MRFCVIGVGRLGYHVATTLADNGMEVLAIDSNAAIIESIQDKVTQAICLHIADEEDLRSVGITDFHTVIVAMGENFAQSILVTALLKQNFKIPRVITRSINKIHRDILRMIGADQIIMPEREIGMKLADTLSLPFHVLTRITPHFSLSYGEPPKKYVGKTVSSLYDGHHITCVGKRIEEKVETLRQDYLIQEHDVLVYAGTNEELEKFFKLK